MKSKIQLSLFSLLTLAVVTACGSGSGDDAAAMQDPEAYVYKGAADPLTSISGEERAGGLADRFDLIQGRQ